LHFWVSVGGSGTLYANLIDTSNVAHSFNSVAGLISPDSWQHVALTYDKASGVAVLYRNGINVAQQNLGTLDVETSLELFLGRRVSVSGGNDRFQGRLDEVTLYNRALSLSEVQSVYNAASSGKCK